jgi:hypothetical protein
LRVLVLLVGSVAAPVISRPVEIISFTCCHILNPTLKPEIGIIGGAGPYAGLNLVKKIFDQTLARTDQDHLPVVLVSLPSYPTAPNTCWDGRK